GSPIEPTWSGAGAGRYSPRAKNVPLKAPTETATARAIIMADARSIPPRSLKGKAIRPGDNKGIRRGGPRPRRERSNELIEPESERRRRRYRDTPPHTRPG